MLRQVNDADNQRFIKHLHSDDPDYARNNHWDVEDKPTIVDKAFEAANLGEPTHADRKWFQHICWLCREKLEGPYNRDDIPAIIEELKAEGYPAAKVIAAPRPHIKMEWVKAGPQDAAKLEVLYELAARILARASEQEYWAPKRIVMEMNEMVGCHGIGCPNYNINCFYDPESGSTKLPCFRSEPSYKLCSSCCYGDMCDTGGENGIVQGIDMLVTLHPVTVLIPKDATKEEKYDLIGKAQVANATIEYGPWWEKEDDQKATPIPKTCAICHKSMTEEEALFKGDTFICTCCYCQGRSIISSPIWNWSV